MPLTIPSLAETRTLSRDGVIEALKVDRIPGNSPAGVLADDNAALAFQVFQFVQRMGVEFLPDLAGEQMLLRWAAIFLPGGRKAATYATLSATMSGPAGTLIPQATQFTVNNRLFQSLADVILGGTDTVTPIAIRALTPGIVGNLDVGVGLALVAAIPGVSSSASVTGITSYGVDIESIDSLRDRVLFRIRKPPMGGDADDYVAWAREVPGVTRAWAAPHEQGLGTMTVRFMMDDLRSANAGFPIQADITAVAAHLDTVRPVTVSDVYVMAPVPQPVNLTIGNLSADTPSTQAAIIASLRAMLKARAAPGSAVNGVLVPGQTIYRAWLSEAVSDADGVDYFHLTAQDAVMPNSGRMAVLGNVFFD